MLNYQLLHSNIDDKNAVQAKTHQKSWTTGIAAYRIRRIVMKVSRG